MEIQNYQTSTTQSYDEELLDQIDCRTFKKASGILIDKLENFEPSEFRYLPSDPLLEQFCCFIDLHPLSYYIYLSKTKYIEFRKCDGVIIEQQNYPNNLQVSQVSGIYHNNQMNQMLFTQDKLLDFYLYAPAENLVKYFNVNFNLEGQMAFRKIKFIIQHEFNNKIFFVGKKNNTGIYSLNIFSKKIKLVLYYQFWSDMNEIVVLDNRTQYGDQLLIFKQFYCKFKKCYKINIKFIQATIKKILYEKEYICEQLTVLKKEYICNSFAQEKLIFQDDNMIILNLQDNVNFVYFVYYKNMKTGEVVIEKKSTLWDNYQNQIVTKNKHLVCLVCPSLNHKTQIMISEANHRFDQRFYMMSIDGADLIFTLEDTDNDKYYALPKRVQFFTQLDELVENVFQIFKKYSTGTIRGSLYDRKIEQNTEFVIKQVISQRTVLKLTKNQKLNPRIKSQDNTLQLEYYDGDQVVTSKTDLSSGNYFSDYIQSKITSFSVYNYYRENYQNLAKLESTDSFDLSMSQSVSFILSKPNSRYRLYKIFDVVVICDHKAGIYIGSYRFEITNVDDILWNEDTPIMELHFTTKRQELIQILHFTDDLQVYVQRDDIDILTSNQARCNLILLTLPSKKKVLLDHRIIYSRVFSHSYFFSNRFLLNPNDPKNIYFVDKCINEDSKYKMYRASLKTDKLQNLSILEEQYMIEELCEIEHIPLELTDDFTIRPKSCYMETGIFLDTPSQQMWKYTTDSRYKLLWVKYDLKKKLWSLWEGRGSELFQITYSWENNQYSEIRATEELYRVADIENRTIFFSCDKVIEVLSKGFFYDFLENKYIEQNLDEGLNLIYDLKTEIIKVERIKDPSYFLFVLRYLMELLLVNSHFVLDKFQLHKVVQVLRNKNITTDFLQRMARLLHSDKDEENLKKNLRMRRMFKKMFVEDVEILNEDQFGSIFNKDQYGG